MLPAAFSHALFLAQASAGSGDKLDTSNPTVFMGMLIAAILVLVTVIDKADGMVQRRKRQPALDSELTKFTAAITTLEGSVKQLSEAKDKHAGHAIQIALLERDLKEQKDKVERYEAANRKYMMETTREIFAQNKADAHILAGKIETLSTSINKEFRDIAADIGALKEAAENAKS